MAKRVRKGGGGNAHDKAVAKAAGGESLPLPPAVDPSTDVTHVREDKPKQTTWWKLLLPFRRMQ